MGEKFIEWYRSPQNEFLQREVDWTLHYFFRTNGFIWIMAASIAGVFVQLGLKYRAAFLALPVPMTGYFFLLAQMVPMILVVAPLWVTLLRRRVFNQFEDARLGDVATSSIEPADFWPALLVAPSLGLYIVSVLGGIPGNLILWSPRLYGDFVAGENLARDSGWFLFQLAHRTLFSAVGYSLFTAVAILFALPRRSISHALSSAIFVWILLTFLSILAGFVSHNVIPSWFGSPQTFRNIISFVFLLFEGLAFWWCLKQLRRRTFWEKLMKPVSS